MRNEIYAWMATCGDEVIVLDDGITRQLPVRQIADSLVYEVMTLPRWWHELWTNEQTMLKMLGFTMHKLSTGWTIRWRETDFTGRPPDDNPADEPADEVPMNSGVTSSESNFHAYLKEAHDIAYCMWLDSVNASLPLPTSPDELI